MLIQKLKEKERPKEKYCRRGTETVKELGRQGIPLQRDECNSNFRRILLLRGKDDPVVAKKFLIIQIRNSKNTIMISIKTSSLTSWERMCYV